MRLEAIRGQRVDLFWESEFLGGVMPINRTQIPPSVRDLCFDLHWLIGNNPYLLLRRDFYEIV